MEPQQQKKLTKKLKQNKQNKCKAVLQIADSGSRKAFVIQVSFNPELKKRKRVTDDKNFVKSQHF